jgi:hypothetical protein
MLCKLPGEVRTWRMLERDPPSDVRKALDVVAGPAKRLLAALRRLDGDARGHMIYAVAERLGAEMGPVRPPSPPSLPTSGDGELVLELDDNLPAPRDKLPSWHPERANREPANIIARGDAHELYRHLVLAADWIATCSEAAWKGASIPGERQDDELAKMIPDTQEDRQGSTTSPSKRKGGQSPDRTVWNAIAWLAITWKDAAGDLPATWEDAPFVGFCNAVLPMVDLPSPSAAHVCKVVKGLRASARTENPDMTIRKIVLIEP